MRNPRQLRALTPTVEKAPRQQRSDPELTAIVERLRELAAVAFATRGQRERADVELTGAVAAREAAERIVAKRRPLSVGAPGILVEAEAALVVAQDAEARAREDAASVAAAITTASAEAATLSQRRAELVEKLNPRRT